MKRELDKVNFIIGLAITLAVIGFIVSGLGCAAGRADDGGIIIGARVSELIETPTHAINAAAGLLPGPWGSIVGALGTTVLGAAGMGWRSAVVAKRNEGAVWDEAQLAVMKHLAEPPKPIEPTE